MRSATCSAATASLTGCTTSTPRRAGRSSKRRGATQLPVPVLFDGRVLTDPTNQAVGESLGAGIRPTEARYDVAIVGGGPAGLAAAVYVGSEGLSTVLIEPEALGGQAGTSSLIRNYLGFPRGISGTELAAGRARAGERLRRRDRSTARGDLLDRRTDQTGSSAWSTARSAPASS